MSLSSFAVPGCHVERVRQQDGELRLVVRALPAGAACPDCRRRSTAPHSTYVRRPADLPPLGQGVRLEVHVRRFYCQNARCARRTVAEPFRGLIDPRSQRTRRLAAAQRRVAVQVGGEASARLLTGLARPASADTLRRLVRTAPLPTSRTPRVLGVDDWARKRGRTYGTILVDLEARRIVDLLQLYWVARLRAHASVVLAVRAAGYRPLARLCVRHLAAATEVAVVRLERPRRAVRALVGIVPEEHRMPALAVTKKHTLGPRLTAYLDAPAGKPTPVVSGLVAALP